MNKKAELKIIGYDFDGVMTNNCVHIDERGRESVKVNRSDGMAVNLIKKLGYQQFILSSESNPVVNERAKKLDIDCFNGIENKLLKINSVASNNNLSLDNFLFIGNDINDKEVLENVGFPFCPEDAADEIKAICTIINRKGGDGVIRELYDLLTLRKI